MHCELYTSQPCEGNTQSYFRTLQCWKCLESMNMRFKNTGTTLHNEGLPLPRSAQTRNMFLCGYGVMNAITGRMVIKSWSLQWAASWTNERTVWNAAIHFAFVAQSLCLNFSQRRPVPVGIDYC